LNDVNDAPDQRDGWVIESQQPLIVTDTAVEARWPDVMTFVQQDGIASFCLLPLTTARRPLGALGFGRRVRATYIDRRVPRHHLAFGRGIHFCVGAPLARLEGRIVLRQLLEQTSSVTLDPERPPRWVDSLMVRRHERLPMRVVPR
jgi:Cytochrome P450